MPATYALYAPCDVVPLPKDRGVSSRESTRNEVWTYLTVPEWFIVYSADEYARFVETRQPSDFPYFSSVGQYWSYYHNIHCATKDAYAFDAGYHFVLFVIGTSYSVEESLKGIYENTLGRLAEMTTTQQTEEDLFSARVAKEYGAFIHTVPWYEFPFAETLGALWRETHFFGPGIIRKWERKAFLTLEYGVKALYSRVIKLGTGGVYEPEELLVDARVEGISKGNVARVPGVEFEGEEGQGVLRIKIPRYEAFSKTVPLLLAEGARFLDIAGNDDVALTALTTWPFAELGSDAELLFEKMIPSEPSVKRMVFRVPVSRLHVVFSQFEKPDVTFEHLYDY